MIRECTLAQCLIATILIVSFANARIEGADVINDETSYQRLDCGLDIHLGNIDVFATLPEDIDSIIKLFGQPDRYEYEDGAVEEFGYEILALYFGTSSVTITNNFITDILIQDDSFKINGIGVEDSRVVVEDRFSLSDASSLIWTPKCESSLRFGFDSKENVESITFLFNIY